VVADGGGGGAAAAAAAAASAASPAGGDVGGGGAEEVAAGVGDAGGGGAEEVAAVVGDGGGDVGGGRWVECCVICLSPVGTFVYLHSQQPCFIPHVLPSCLGVYSSATGCDRSMDTVWSCVPPKVPDKDGPCTAAFYPNEVLPVWYTTQLTHAL
jgi:hypothetical protein